MEIEEKANGAADAPLYEVIMQDEHDNLCPLGFHRAPDDAVGDANGFLAAYEDDGAVPLEKGDLAEYASTFGSRFDREVERENEEDCPGTIMVGGFVLSAEAVAEDAGRALGAAEGAQAPFFSRGGGRAVTECGAQGAAAAAREAGHASREAGAASRGEAPTMAIEI